MNLELRRCKRKASLLTVEQDERESKAEEEELESRLSCVGDDILVEILIRLPHSKSAIRGKPVCKRWNSLISGGYFITRYTAHHGAPNSCTVIFKWKIPVLLKHVNLPQLTRQCRPGVLAFPSHPCRMVKTKPSPRRIIDNISRRTVHHLDLDFLALPLPEYRVPKEPPLWVQAEASCHDLLLLSRFGVYYLVNPHSRRWIGLPSAPLCGSRESTLYGAGLLSQWDHCTNCLRFKVVRIPIGAIDRDGNEVTITAPVKYSATRGYGPYVLDDVSRDEFSVHIFCSESKRWTEHIVKWYPFLLTRYIFHFPIVSHNGMLYWFNGRSIVCLNPFGLVVDDDGRLRLTRTIGLPPGEGDFPVGTSRCELLGFGVTGGHFRLIIDHRVTERALKIWELDESETGGAGGVWRLVHLVQVSKFFDRELWTRGFGFLSFQPYDGDIFFLHILNYIYLINLRTGKLKTVGLPTPPIDRGPIVYYTIGIPPLLHQWFPTPLACSPCVTFN